MKLSILMAAYNAQDYLGAALDSLVNQCRDGVDLDVVVVDDASTDATGKVLEDYVGRYPWMRSVHRLVNGGEGPARNSGFDLVNGDWLMMLDADDLIVPGSLVKLISFLSTSTADAVLFRFKFMETENGYTFPNVDAWHPEWYPTGGFCPAEHPDRLYSAFWPGIYNKVFRMGYVRGLDFRFQDIPRIGDVQFNLGALSLARRVDLFEEFVYIYRINNPRSLINSGDRFPLSFFQAACGLQDVLCGHGLWETFHKGFQSWFVENLTYNLSILHTYEGFCRLAQAYIDEGYTRFEMERCNREDVLYPERYDGCRLLKEKGPDAYLMAAWRWEMKKRTDESNWNLSVIKDLRQELEDARDQKRRADAERERCERELSDIWGSVSMKTGRAITAFPRKIREVLAERGHRSGTK